MTTAATAVPAPLLTPRGHLRLGSDPEAPPLPAVLYGVGARLDRQPELIFALRRVDPKDLVAQAGAGLRPSKSKPAPGIVLDEHLALPFDTTVLGAAVKVVRLDVRDDNTIVGIRVHGRKRQLVPILELPLPSPKPAGAEWIEAYRLWAGGTS